MANKNRQDLKDISNTVEHLLLLSKYFDNKMREWMDLWHNYGVQANFYRTNDKELIRTAEELYRAGESTAQDLSILLGKINDVKDCPRLKDYINEIRCYQQKCIGDDEKLLFRCEKIISERNRQIPYVEGDFEIMVDWHREQLKILKDLDSELAAIEASERYKIEEQEQLQPQAEKQQKAAPAKPEKESLWWKLYEKTLKAFFDSVLGKFQP